MLKLINVDQTKIKTCRANIKSLPFAASDLFNEIEFFNIIKLTNVSVIMFYLPLLYNSSF